MGQNEHLEPILSLPPIGMQINHDYIFNDMKVRGKGFLFFCCRPRRPPFYHKNAHNSICYLFLAYKSAPGLVISISSSLDITVGSIQSHSITCKLQALIVERICDFTRRRLRLSSQMVRGVSFCLGHPVRSV